MVEDYRSLTAVELVQAYLRYIETGEYPKKKPETITEWTRNSNNGSTG